MSWIQIIEYAQSKGKLRKIYDRIKGPGNYIDNIMTVHSLRPHTIEGHMMLYKNVLHHRSNTLPMWLLELIGVYISLLNDCTYCFEHHREGFRRHLPERDKAEAMLSALEKEHWADPFTDREIAVLKYVRTLTQHPARVSENLVNELRAQQLDDGEILEINQVASYFAYANRTVLGLGVTTQGEKLGLSPGNTDDAEDWSHR